MNKKKSKALAFLLATALIVPSANGSIYAMTNSNNLIDSEREIENDIKEDSELNSVSGETTNTVFPQGSGTKEDPYQISDIDTFKRFRDSVNKGNKYEGEYIELTNDIDLNWEKWTPIGTYSKHFGGNFNGGNYTISNLYIKKTGVEYSGLFGRATSSAVIENLTINNANIIAGGRTGVILGESLGKGNRLSNIKLKGDINITGKQNVAAIVGLASGGSEIISSITIDGNINIKGSQYVGTIVGRSSVGFNEISNIKLNGNVNVISEQRVGAIVGESSKLSEKISDIEIKGILNVNGTWYVGGVIGYGSVKNIENCIIDVNEGSYVKGTGSYIGGIQGYNSSGDHKIINCKVNNLKITGVDRMGGISGIIHKGNIIKGCSVTNTTIEYDKELGEGTEKANTLGTIAGANLAAGESGTEKAEKVQILNCTAENTYVYFYDNDTPSTQKVSMLSNLGNPVSTGTIVGDSVVIEGDKVTGGTFELLTEDMYDSNTLKQGNIGNGQFILVEKDVVVMIGDTKYKSLEEALGKVESGQTINLVDDITIDAPLNIESKTGITIDFNENKINTSKNFSGESVIILKDSDNTTIENVNFNITEGAEKAIKIDSSKYASIKNIEVKNSNTDKVVGVSIENESIVNLSGKISSDKGTVVSVVSNSTVDVKDSLNVEGQGKVEISEGSKLNINENTELNLSVDLTNNGTITNKGNLENTGTIINNGTLENTGSLNLGDKVEGNIPEVEDKVFAIETTTNTITIKAIEGINAEYAIEKDNSKVIRNASKVEEKEWKTPDENGLVTFTNLNSGTKYKILARYKNVQDANISEVLNVKTKEVYYPGGGTGGGSSKPEKPTYTHEKIEGLDRYETAAKIADKLGSYDTAVLVNATSTMSDGLSAAGLAGKEDAAILLVKKDSIPKATMDRLKKVKKVYIIGGENAISKKVSDEITKNVPKVEVERLGGKTRVETSELVAKEIGNYSNAFIVNGFKGEADAMSASSVAARYEAPILLTNGKTSTHAKKAGVEYYVIGGKNVVDKSIADKYNAEVLAGKDRYATNREVIDEFYSGSDKLYLANGDKLVDALTASPLAKNNGIVLVNKKSDKSILKDKNTVQVGGMDFEIEFE